MQLLVTTRAVVWIEIGTVGRVWTHAPKVTTRAVVWIEISFVFGT